MSKRQSIKTFFFCIMVFLCSGHLAAGESEKPASLEQQVEGLWLYTGLVTSAGKDLPLNGIFLFKEGVFVQYSVFKGEPIKDQGAMAHAGSYSVGEEFVHLVAEQTISTAPLESAPLTSQGPTEHDLAVSRSGKELTLTFSKGTGTVQTFELAGSGSGEVYKLENGALALVDGYFILVDGNEDGFDAGYGTYEKDKDSLKLKITRWTEADETAAPNLNDTSMKATFDGQTLSLDDGRSFQVTP
ncbi:MAG: hypothetical protein ACI9SC_002341 [Gammaproteobacteria bacterium]|jgi:hypothetical protein